MAERMVAECTARTCGGCGAVYSTKRCLACQRARAKERYDADPARYRAKAKQYRKEHPDPSVLRAALREWHAANPDKVHVHRKRRLARRYNMTLEDYVALLTAQDGVCAICRSTPPPGTILFVDHCHATGVVRELLCVGCNTRVAAHEHPLAAETGRYLKKHGGRVGTA